MRPAIRPSRLGLVLLIALGSGLRPTLAEEPTLPTPPVQADAWTPPPTTLPRFLIAATATLCEQGLADPRGCDYRAIRVVVGTEPREVDADGWVLPAAPGESPRYAIAWNGLVYPLVAKVGPADLDADVRQLALFGEKAGQPRRLDFMGRMTQDESTSIQAEFRDPIKVCLLLRLGRADLAEAAWRAVLGKDGGEKPAGSPPKLSLKTYGVSYLTLARELAWYRHERAIAAHLRGDDPLALADARAITRLAREVDARAEALGFDRPDQPAQAGRAVPYFNFLEQLPLLLADQERRLRERSDPLPPPRGGGRDARIAAMIRGLDQVAERPWAGPGGVSMSGATAVKDLIAEGDAAVEPLLWALRTDPRLTRTPGSGGAQPVAEAAHLALIGILKADSSAIRPLDQSDDSPEARKAAADQLQAFWEKNRAVPLAERWYRTLLDDAAGPSDWDQAASNITRPEKARPAPDPRRPVKASPFAPAPPSLLAGESLRSGRRPSVTALLSRRVDSMLKTPDGQDFNLAKPCQMAGHLVAWDPVGALPMLRDLMRICRERYAHPSNVRDWTNQNLAGSIAWIALARDNVGDSRAFPEYAQWIRTTRPEWLEDRALSALSPILERPDDPTLAAAAAWLFEDPRSPWVPLINRDGAKSKFQVASLISSPLVEVPAFRKLLLKGLEDRKPVGKAEVAEGGGTTVKLEGLTMGRSNPKDAEVAPIRSGEVSIRMCDFYAWQLTQLEVAPRFHACWPEARRDDALVEMTAFLRAKSPR